MLYLVIFIATLVVDLIPIIAPPAWTIMVFLLVKYQLNPWLVLVVGVTGSTLGRYIFSLYVPKIADRLIKQHKKEELEFMGKKLSHSLWQSWLFVFIYTLTPLSTSALFTAAAVAKVKAWQTVPPFFFGKLISDAAMIFTGRYAAANLQELGAGVFSIKGIITIVLGLLLLGGFMFMDWRMLLQEKKLKFNFAIWK